MISRRAFLFGVVASAAIIPVVGPHSLVSERPKLYPVHTVDDWPWQPLSFEFSITEEALDDGLYGDINAKYRKSMQESLRYVREIQRMV